MSKVGSLDGDTGCLGELSREGTVWKSAKFP